MDPFSSQEFDAVLYLNKVFNDQSSLSSVEDVRAAVYRSLKSVSRKLQDDLEHGAQSNQEAAIAGLHNVVEQLQDAKSFISELAHETGQVHDGVAFACHEIRKWDSAKEKLQNTVSMVRRVEMLESGLSQLERAFSEKRFDEVGSLIGAIRDLAAHLYELESVSSVARLLQTSRSLLDNTKTKTYDLLELCLSESKSRPRAIIESLANIVDAFGEETRKEVVVALYRARVEQYRRIFDPRRGGEHAALEQMERRLSWISRIGGSIEEISANSLPESWTFAESFYLELIRETADHVRYLTRNVDETLLSAPAAIKEAMNFEDELMKRFPAFCEPDNDVTTSAVPDETTVDGVRKKFEMFRARGAKKRRSLFYGTLTKSFTSVMSALISEELKEIEYGTSKALQKEQFECPLSSLVTKRLEGSALKEAVDQVLRTESEEFVLESSGEIFLMIKSVFERQAALAARVGTLLQLYKGLTTAIERYCKNFIGLVKEKIEARQGSVWSLQGSLISACLAVNTVAYCQETSSAITTECETIAAKDVHLKDLAEELRNSLESSEDFWIELVSKAMKRVIGAMEGVCAKAFAEAKLIDWANLEDAGDQSTYMKNFRQNIKTSATLASALLKKSDFEYCWSSLALSVVGMFRSKLFTWGKLSASALQQLLLDSHSLKEACEEGRILTRDGASDPRMLAFLRSLNEEVTNVQGVLKTLMAPPVSQRATYDAVVKDGTEKEFALIVKMRSSE